MKKINKNEKGFTLVLSLVLLLVMSLMGGALIVISSGDHQSNNTSDEYQQAFYVAETALLEGEKQIINAYMGPWVDVNKIKVAKPADGAGDEENKKYEEWVTLQNKLNPSEVTPLNPDGESLTQSHARNVDDRAMPRNDWNSWEDVSTNCKESFKNLLESTTGEVLVTHQPVRKSFYDLIKPIFSNKTDIDSTVYKKRDGTAKDIDDIIKKEENFLNRFEYEYFSMNIGTAAYIGTGSSIKKTSSDSQSSAGTAYKIYGCGIFMNKAITKAEIIIPLETVIVMPN